MSDVDTPNRDLSLLAPAFRRAVETAVEDCRDRGFPVKVNEGFRSQARQSWLYRQGRSRPGDIVTNAPTSLTSWHGYGLAVDVIHATEGYNPAPTKAGIDKWFADVAAIFKTHGCKWGGDWTKPDRPHMQWGRCTASPTQGARNMMSASGPLAVWASLGADH